MFEIENVLDGQFFKKGKFVPNSGGRNGILVRHEITESKGKKYDNIIVYEVFLSKKGDWHVQRSGPAQSTQYGAPFKVRMPTESMGQVMECMNEVYAEIYGAKKEMDTITVIDEPKKEPKRAKKSPSKTKVMKELDKLGF